MGGIYHAMRRCLTHVFSFIMTYVVITASFASGLHFVLVWSSERCADGDAGVPVFRRCRNGTTPEHENTV